MALLRKTLSLSALTIAALLAAGPGLARAAQEEPPQLSEETQDTINETVRPASDAKQWDKVLTAVDGILAKVPADSYDAAVMYSIRAQTCLQKSDPTGALDALERGLVISDQHHYFSDKITEETVYNISQLSYQEGATTKDPKVQAECYAKTLAFLGRWLKGQDSTTLTQDNIQFIASVYFTLGQGMEVGGMQKTDVPLMEKALYWIDRGLRAAATPRDVFYQLKISALFQLDAGRRGMSTSNCGWPPSRTTRGIGNSWPSPTSSSPTRPRRTTTTRPPTCTTCAPSSPSSGRRSSTS